MEQQSINKEFNKSAEQILANRMDAYNLTTDEKEQIWQMAGERDGQLKSEKINFKENYNDLYKKEFDRLRGEDQPKPELKMGNNRTSYSHLASLAQANVQKYHENNLSGIQKNTDKQINTILMNSKERDKQQNPDMQRDFQQAHDHNRDR